MHDRAVCSTAQGPLYALGDLVVIGTEAEDGFLTDYGFIKGIELDPSHCSLKGWWYCVHILGGKGNGLEDWAPESDIQGQVIHGKQRRERSIHSEVRHRESSALAARY